MHGVEALAHGDRLVGGASGARSDHERHALLLQARTDFLHSPLFGIGPRVVNEAHDVYLQLLASGGVIALASFLVFVGGLVLALRSGLRVDRRLALACGAATGTWLLVGVVENQLVEPYLYVPAGLLVGLAALARRARLA